MTRVNADLEPLRLTDQHLLAEYKEMADVYGHLRKSLKAFSLNDLQKKISNHFVLGNGHITFFYNKLSFLRKRYKKLKDELNRRGYHLDSNRVITKRGEFPKKLYGDWKASETDRRVICERVVDRIRMKTSWYTYSGDSVNEDFIHLMYGEYL